MLKNSFLDLALRLLKKNFCFISDLYINCCKLIFRFNYNKSCRLKNSVYFCRRFQN